MVREQKTCLHVNNQSIETAVHGQGHIGFSEKQINKEKRKKNKKEKKKKEKKRERVLFFFLSSKPPPLWLFIPFSNSRVAMPCRACLCVLPCLFSYGLARCDQVCALAGTSFS